ncbi:MAG: putative glycosyltransferase [Phenylobacterium sp.]|nr:putative glycosyltransferase [Phenylobacterium sp.]
MRDRHPTAWSQPLSQGSDDQSIELLTQNLDDPGELARLKARFEVERQTPAYRKVFTTESPLVTVCVTTADRGAVLAERALTSMRQQTYRNLQVVVVGDQCEDDTAEQVAAFKDDRFTFVNLPERGPYPQDSYNRWLVAGTHPANEGLRLCRGDLVTHIDEDDTFDPDRIQTLVEALQMNEADLVYHPFWWEEEDRSMTLMGDGRFELGQTGTSMVLYHRWFVPIPWDVHAYRTGEPGDWNRFRKIKALGARTHFVPAPLTWHWKYPRRGPFVAKAGERFLDSVASPESRSPG